VVLPESPLVFQNLLAMNAPTLFRSFLHLVVELALVLLSFFSARNSNCRARSRKALCCFAPDCAAEEDLGGGGGQAVLTNGISGGRGRGRGRRRRRRRGRVVPSQSWALDDRGGAKHNFERFKWTSWPHTVTADFQFYLESVSL
jgi:hypothetical protein